MADQRNDLAVGMTVRFAHQLASGPDHQIVAVHPNDGSPLEGMITLDTNPGEFSPFGLIPITDEVRELLHRLGEYYAAADLQQWLTAEHPLLHGRRPIRLLADGRVDEVLRLLDQLDDGVYL